MRSSCLQKIKTVVAGFILYASPPQFTNFQQTLRTILGISFNLLRSPINACKLFRIETKKQKASKALKAVLLNSHILPHKLDWLHFGFATMGLGRENVAETIGAKCGVSLRGYDISSYPLKNLYCYSKLWEKTNKVHALSNAIVEKAQKNGLSNKKDIQIIPPALDVDKTPLKQDPGGLSEPLRFVSVGRLTWQKGFEYGLNALKQLKEAGVNFQYKIIGGGYDFERLKFTAYQLGIDNKVEFLGKLNHLATIEQIQAANIYLQPSVQEGFCNAVQEAQACGLLCIVSDAEGLPENVLHQETGWVVPKRNPAALCKKIKEVLAMSQHERQNITRQARKRIEQHFTLEHQKQQFIAFFPEE